MKKLDIRTIKRRLKVIESEVSQLVEDKYYFERYKEYIKNSKNINKSNDFLFFIAKNYQILSVINIYKQVDTRNDVESLINLLQDIKKHKRIFNLNWFIKKYPKWMKNNGIVDFRRFSTNNNKSISCQKINKDIKKIEKAINGSRFGKKRQSVASLTKYRHKRGVHFAKGNPEVSVPVQNLYKAIDLLEQMVIKYNLLINQTGMETLLSSNVDEFIQFDEIFKS